MSHKVRIPSKIKIYHITHLKNLPKMIEESAIWSDSKRMELELNCEIVGMTAIKKRRLEKLEVRCHPGTKVGQYVPFYFCSRSIMLYILHMGNLPGVIYSGGQEPMVHLQSDMKAVVQWAEKQNIKWAFSDGNAGSVLTNFFKNESDLIHVNWDAVNSEDFRDSLKKEGKQAEFLMFESFPWQLVEKIGIINNRIENEIISILTNADHKPFLTIEKSWYY